ncbi:malectin domain-containing carbohydrate-binding protein [Dyadobacter sp. NIV53]|uniref:CBM96 family carbohydrate-binding protein n=1 Tax=Dyadobacter sp. NIV53 TaxID=2861765 RepID=UPI001C87F579|nr:malectin domain-containing carbohydrate-binding protein [Dyadobacter sp. NIV53]
MKLNLPALKTSLLGLVFLFYLPASFAQNWEQTFKAVASDRNSLTAGGGIVTTEYSRNVTLSGDYTAASGIPKEGPTVYVSKKINGKWVQIQKILAPEPGDFGMTLAMDGDYLLVGNGLATFIYKKNLGGEDNWGYLKKLVSIFPAGASIAIKGNYAIVGAPGDSTDIAGTNYMKGAGSAFIFSKDAGGTDNWGQIKKIVAPNRVVNDYFGSKVSLSTHHAMIGSYNIASIHQQTKGGTDNWGLIQEIVLPPTDYEYLTSHPVSITEDYAIIGMPHNKLPEVSNYAVLSGYVTILKNNHNSNESWAEIQKIGPPSPQPYGFFGIAVAIDGDYIVVGEDQYEEVYFGVAHIFQKDTSNPDVWNLNKTLNPIATAYSRTFGNTVDIDGDRAIVGDNGSAYLFQKNTGGANTWGQEKRLVIMRPNPGDQYGSAVAISGNYAIVGALNDDMDIDNDNYVASAGSAYILVKNGNNWQTVKKLVGLPREEDTNFGLSVAIYDTLAVVGAPYEGQNSSTGALYVYSKNQGGANNWGLVTKLSLPVTGDYQFGYSVFINNSYIAVGVLGDHSINSSGTTISNSGAVYLYQKNHAVPGSWSMIKKVIASSPAYGDHFGASVSMSGDYLLVGAPDNDYDVTKKIFLVNSGSAYLYGKNIGGENNWGQIEKITSDARKENGKFGSVVSMSGDYALITSKGVSGSATIYKKDAGGIGNWGILKKLVAEGGNAPISFGYDASLTDAYAVVGAPGGSGSAYIFKKNLGGTNNWGLQHLITASVPASGDRFGAAVSADGNNILIGAPDEDEDGEEKNTLFNAGSVYFFHNSGDDTEPIASVRINSGGEAFTTSDDRTFGADQYFSGTTKTAAITPGDIQNTTDDELYRDARFGSSFSYKIPVTNGRLNVVLHFAETYWGAGGRGGTNGLHRRHFNVDVEGIRKLTNYDIFASAGGAMRAVQETFAVTVFDGILNIDFMAGNADNPIISAIEILPVQQVTFSPVADASVRSTPYSGTNYGYDSSLEVKSGSTESYIRNAYLKFPLTDLGRIGSAKLRLYGSNAQNSTGVNLAVYSVNNDTWKENTIVYSNAPSLSRKLGSVIVDTNAKYYEIDVTDFVKQQAGGDKTASFVLSNPDKQNSLVVLNSRENTENQPQLIVEYSTVADVAVRSGQEDFVDEERISSSIVYPNPVKKQFTVEVSDRHVGKVDLYLNSVSGQSYQIKQSGSKISESVIEADISSEQLSEGIYLLRIQSSSFTEVVKILVMEK